MERLELVRRNGSSLLISLSLAAEQSAGRKAIRIIESAPVPECVSAGSHFTPNLDYLLEGTVGKAA